VKGILNEMIEFATKSEKDGNDLTYNLIRKLNLDEGNCSVCGNLKLIISIKLKKNISKLYFYILYFSFLNYSC